jgi:N-acetyl-beta-hexosaminidase
MEKGMVQRDTVALVVSVVSLVSTMAFSAYNSTLVSKQIDVAIENNQRQISSALEANGKQVRSIVDLERQRHEAQVRALANVLYFELRNYIIDISPVTIDVTSRALSGDYDAEEFRRAYLKDPGQTVRLHFADAVSFEPIIYSKSVDKIGIFDDDTIVAVMIAYDNISRNQKGMLNMEKSDFDREFKDKSIAERLQNSEHWAIHAANLLYNMGGKIEYKIDEAEVSDKQPEK